MILFITTGVKTSNPTGILMTKVLFCVTIVSSHAGVNLVICIILMVLSKFILCNQFPMPSTLLMKLMNVLASGYLKYLVLDGNSAVL
jgi:hypothetical protein